MTYKTILKGSASVLMLVAISACDNSDNINPPDPIVTPGPTPTPSPSPSPTTGTFQSRFGNAFAAIFNRDETQDPVDPQQSDVPPLAPASDPLDNN